MKRIINEMFGENKKEKLIFFYLMAIIYLQYSLWMLQYSVFISLILTVIMIFFISNIYTRLVIKKNMLYLTIIFINLISISCLINFSIDFNDIITISLWICALFICSNISFDSFCKAYVRIIAFLAFMGTIIYIMSVLNTDMFNIFTDISNQGWTGGLIPKNVFFAVVDVSSFYKRAFGIFYEPGLFAFHISLALFLELFASEKLNIKLVFILLMGLSVTFSTSGYITLIIIIFALLFSNFNVMSRKNKKKLILLISIGICFIGIYMYFNPSNWVFLTSKLSELNMSSSEGSGFERFRAIIYSINIFFNNPIFGTSSKYFSEYFNGFISTFTPLNWLSIYGFFYGVLCNFGYARLAFRKKENLISIIFKMLALFSMISTQNVSAYLIIFIIIIYNLDFKKVWNNKERIK